MVPLRILAVGILFAVGVVLADGAGAPAAVAAGAGAGGLAALAAVWLVHRARPPPRDPGGTVPRLTAAQSAAVLAGVAALGFSSAGLRVAAFARAELPALDGRVVMLAGRVSSDPVEAGRARRFLLRTLTVDGRQARETVALRVFGEGPGLEFGDRVAVEARIARLDRSDPFDERLYRKWVAAEATAPGAAVRVESRASNPVLATANHVRGRMDAMARASRHQAGAGLLLGLVIGDERLIPERVREDFRATGLTHLLAVSGANVAVVVGAVLLGLRAVRAPRRAQIAAGLAAVGFFAVVTRWEPSVLRASLMASLALGAFLFGRRYDARHGLGLAFVGLLGADPFLLWSAGFQLSFAATLGILVMTPRLLEHMPRLPRPVAEALAVGLGAQIAVAPLLVFHFGRASLVSVPANLAAVAMVAPATVSGVAAAVLGSVWQPLGAPPFEAGALLASLLRGVAGAFAGVPLGSVTASGLGVRHLVALYLAVAGLTFRLAAGRGARAPAVAAAVSVLLLVVPPAGSPAPGGLRLTFFDVGQGDAALAESPGGARVLVDGGPDPERIASTLRGRGIRRVDVVVYSHPHADHVNGLAAVLERLEVGMFLHPGTASGPAERGRAGRVEVARTGDAFVAGDLELEVLGPDDRLRSAAAAAREVPGQGASEGSAVNDASVVLRLSWGGGCALFTGDVEEAGQEALLQRRPARLDCSVLKAPHHGSARLLSEFVQAVDAEWVAVSVGPNDYGHPSGRAVGLFEEEGGRILRTDRLGDVVLELARDGAVRLGR